MYKFPSTKLSVIDLDRQGVDILLLLFSLFPDSYEFKMLQILLHVPLKKISR